MNTQQDELNIIKSLINKNEFTTIQMEVGLSGAILSYKSKKEFGERVLNAYANDKMVRFVSLKNDIITFKEIKMTRILTESQQRGYGLGNYQGD